VQIWAFKPANHPKLSNMILNQSAISFWGTLCSDIRIVVNLGKGKQPRNLNGENPPPAPSPQQALLNCSFGREWDEQHCWFAGFLMEPKARKVGLFVIS